MCARSAAWSLSLLQNSITVVTVPIKVVLPWIKSFSQSFNKCHSIIISFPFCFFDENSSSSEDICKHTPIGFSIVVHSYSSISSTELPFEHLLSYQYFIDSYLFIIIKSFVVVVKSLSHVWLFATPKTAICQASLSSTISLNLLRLMSIELVTQSNHLILWHPLHLPLSMFPSIRVFSKTWVSSSHQVAKVLEFQLQHQSFRWIFRTNFL